MVQDLNSLLNILLNDFLGHREVGWQYNLTSEPALCCQLKMILSIRIGTPRRQWESLRQTRACGLLGKRIICNEYMMAKTSESTDGVLIRTKCYLKSCTQKSS